MRISTKAKIEKCASRDQSRPVLCTPYLRITEQDGESKGTLEATDSYALVRVPVELDEGDTEGFVPAEVLAAARKSPAAKVAGDAVITANGDLRVGDGVIYPRPELGPFPETERLIPDDWNEFEVALDAKLLYSMAQAFGSDRVRLRFVQTADYKPSNLRPIGVRPLDGSEADGILMPIRLG